MMGKRREGGVKRSIEMSCKILCILWGFCKKVLLERAGLCIYPLQTEALAEYMNPRKVC